MKITWEASDITHGADCYTDEGSYTIIAKDNSPLLGLLDESSTFVEDWMTESDIAEFLTKRGCTSIESNIEGMSS